MPLLVLVITGAPEVRGSAMGVEINGLNREVVDIYNAQLAQREPTLLNCLERAKTKPLWHCVW